MWDDHTQISQQLFERFKAILILVSFNKTPQNVESNGSSGHSYFHTPQIAMFVATVGWAWGGGCQHKKSIVSTGSVLYKQCMTWVSRFTDTYLN